MFLINDVPQAIDPALVALLRQAEPATIGHFRHVGFMDPAVRSLLSGHRIAGTASPCAALALIPRLSTMRWASCDQATCW